MVLCTILAEGAFSSLTLMVGHPACKKWGNGGGGHCLVWMEWRPSGWSVCLPLLIFPCTIKSRSSLLAPAHPGGPGKKDRKTVVVWWWWCYKMDECLCILYCCLYDMFCDSRWTILTCDIQRIMMLLSHSFLLRRLSFSMSGTIRNRQDFRYISPVYLLTCSIAWLHSTNTHVIAFNTGISHLFTLSPAVLPE